MFNTSIAKKMKRFATIGKTPTIVSGETNYPSLSRDNVDASIVSDVDKKPNIFSSNEENDEQVIQNNIYGGLENLKRLPVSELPLQTDMQICVFHIKYFGIKPVLLFNLYNRTNVLEWPTISPGKMNYDEIVEKIKKYFKNGGSLITYEGVFSHDGKNQIWFRYSDKNDIAQLCSYSDKYVWCLCSEIVNEKKYLNIDIHDNVVSFFLDNPDFLYIKDPIGNIHATPIVGYYGNSSKSIAYTAVFGRTRSAQRRYGSFYYFGTYAEGMRYAVWTMNYKPLIVSNKSITVDKKGRYERGGLVRFILFMNNVNAFLDRESDPIIDINETYDNDDAQAKFVRSNTQKVRDTTGKWSENYDTIFNGRIYKKKGDKDVDLKPLIVVKKYDQQIPLTYYYVDTSQKNIDITADPNSYVVE